MHPSLEKLLELRDDEGDAEVARHVRFCGQCADEVAGLRATAAALRSLPAMVAGEDQWPRLVEQVITRRRRSWMIRGATAAAAVLAIVSAVLVMSVAPHHDGAPSLAGVDARLAVEQLVSASRELELVLQNPSLRSQVLSPGRAAMIVDIEDRIALVDLALAESLDDSPDERAVALWSDRVELLDALVTTRAANPKSETLVFANHSIEGSR